MNTGSPTPAHLRSFSVQRKLAGTLGRVFRVTDAYGELIGVCREGG